MSRLAASSPTVLTSNRGAAVGGPMREPIHFAVKDSFVPPPRGRGIPGLGAAHSWAAAVSSDIGDILKP